MRRLKPLLRESRAPDQFRRTARQLKGPGRERRVDRTHIVRDRVAVRGRVAFSSLHNDPALRASLAAGLRSDSFPELSTARTI